MLLGDVFQIKDTLKGDDRNIIRVEVKKLIIKEE